MAKRGFFGVKMVSSEDIDIERAATHELSETTKKVIRKSQVESLRPLLDSNPKKTREALKKLRRQYWGIPEPEKAA